MPKGNPEPIQTEAFKERQFRREDGTEPLAKETIQIRLTESVNKLVFALPNRSVWLRRVITEAAERELVPQEQEPNA